MDKQNRLTKIEEWEIGGEYHWKKGKYTSGGKATCESIDAKSKYIKMNEDGLVLILGPKQWPNRWTKATQ